MSKKIDIDHTLIKMPVRITIDDEDYPLTQWNVSVVREYWETNDESVLEKLKDFTLVF